MGYLERKRTWPLTTLAMLHPSEVRQLAKFASTLLGDLQLQRNSGKPSSLCGKGFYGNRPDPKALAANANLAIMLAGDLRDLRGRRPTYFLRTIPCRYVRKASGFRVAR